MAYNVTEVFRVIVPSVGLVLKARADIDGKQIAYRKRIAEDSPGDEAAALTEYSATTKRVGPHWWSREWWSRAAVLIWKSGQ